MRRSIFIIATTPNPTPSVAIREDITAEVTAISGFISELERKARTPAT